jgi:hypothetical protein
MAKTRTEQDLPKSEERKFPLYVVRTAEVFAIAFLALGLKIGLARQGHQHDYLLIQDEGADGNPKLQVFDPETETFFPLNQQIDYARAHTTKNGRSALDLNGNLPQDIQDMYIPPEEEVEIVNGVEMTNRSQPRGPQSINISADNTKAVYSSRDQVTYLSSLTLIDLSDGSAKQFTAHTHENQTQPLFSPTGDAIAYLSSTYGEDLETQVKIINLDGKEIASHSFRNSEVYSYVWSPDGKKVLISFPGDGIIELGILDVQMNEFTTLSPIDITNTSVQSNSIPFTQFAPDGKSVFFLSVDRKKLYEESLDTKIPQVIAHTNGNELLGDIQRIDTGREVELTGVYQNFDQPKHGFFLLHLGVDGHQPGKLEKIPTGTGDGMSLNEVVVHDGE